MRAEMSAVYSGIRWVASLVQRLAEKTEISSELQKVVMKEKQTVEPRVQ